MFKRLLVGCMVDDIEIHVGCHGGMSVVFGCSDLGFSKMLAHSTRVPCNMAHVGVENSSPCPESCKSGAVSAHERDDQPSGV